MESNRRTHTGLALAEQQQSDNAFLPAGIALCLDGGINGGADLAGLFLALEAEEAFLGGFFWGRLEDLLEGVYGDRHGIVQAMMCGLFTLLIDLIHTCSPTPRHHHPLRIHSNYVRTATALLPPPSARHTAQQTADLPRPSGPDGLICRQLWCIRFSALIASLLSITHEMLISLAPWLIISIFTLPSASVVNILPAIPTMFRMCFPTSDSIAISLCTDTCFRFQQKKIKISIQKPKGENRSRSMDQE